MHHQVFEDFLQLVQGGYRHLVLDRLLVRGLALSEQTICTGRDQKLINEDINTLEKFPLLNNCDL